MSLRLDDIKNFITISETLNITRASEILGLSQPTLSYSVKRLEREFGCLLIIRLKNGIQLTKPGQDFYGRAKKLILFWEDSQKSLTSDTTEILTEFSIGIHPSVAIYTLKKILPNIYKSYPKISFKLVHGLSREMTQKVINWEVDLAIAINPIQHPDLVIVELNSDNVTLFARKNCRNKIIFDPQLAQSLSILKKLNKAKVDFDGHIQSSNLEVIAKLTSEGLGYGLLPTRVASNYKNIHSVKDAPNFKDKICLIYRREKHLNSVSQNLLKLIKTSSI